MALFIRDDEVDALATELQKATRSATKKDAVRQALKNELARTRDRSNDDDLLNRALAMADAMGESDPTFDMKKFTDEMWGDL
ncbi:MAG: type II toxin-antitoxin system VapB family antitoxin [Mesorhizobium sp.]|mgnify:CR=1 FL=1|nr:type II toxin-antitoxin system VapB family antitoxin [Mesorhizobium sp.]MCO5162009.1 type II toxin-antitoxin system VapB family antitoxin [Mesorhizobium sp.]